MRLNSTDDNGKRYGVFKSFKIEYGSIFYRRQSTSYGENIVLQPQNVLLLADVHETRNLRFKARRRIRIADW